MGDQGRYRGSDNLRPKKRSINPELEKYLQSTAMHRDEPSAWLTTPEVPTAAEMGSYRAEGEAKIPIEVPINRIKSAWTSKETYLESHYRLLREDAVAPLRSAVDEVRFTPDLLEKDSHEHAGLYDNAYITGMTFSNQGIAAHIEFSMHRAEKQVRWEQSKRLTSGNIVALTTVDDMFKTICIVAVVAARPLSGLQQVRPAIDIFFQDAASIEIDPAMEFFMVEARSAYFEAYRHTLCGLQKMAGEVFPLSEHLVNIQPQVLPPAYVQSQPERDLQPVFGSQDGRLSNHNILTNWPDTPLSSMDASQIAALHQILTKRVAIVQGPPGTGKTYVAVQAMKVLLKNMKPGDPPIIVAAQTNHALDQLLRHVASFERNFLRLGSRSTDFEVVQPRTLRNVRYKYKMPLLPGCAQGRGRKNREQITQQITKLCEPLLNKVMPLSAKELLQYGAISKEQHDFLENGIKSVVDSKDNLSPDAVTRWLSRGSYVLARRPVIPDLPAQFEEVDEEYEQLREVEAEQTRVEVDDEYEALHGKIITFLEPWTGEGYSVRTYDWARRVSQTQNLWKVPANQRGPVYACLRGKVVENIRNKFRELASSYDEAIGDFKLGLWEMDSEYLKRARVIGVTTTGLNKYRGLLSSVSPRVLLIEEASETLEANIATACFPTTEHLILVGDHQQLRPHCACKELEGEPYYLAVSLFERLVNVGLEFAQLNTQRRMAPEIRALLSPIYKNLVDHPSVLNRPDVPGMGTTKSYFYTHQFEEANDEYMSKVNHHEAAMIVGFVDYLVLNGTPIENITVLTFYNGQRKLIVKGLKGNLNMQGLRFNVNTVDSYQGEENEVIILSLVRNKREGGQKGIGFLSIANRVCVALSRAKRGFYIFGNHDILSQKNDLWEKVIRIMIDDVPRRIGTALPVTCQTHGTVKNVKRPHHWKKLPGGGCTKVCDETLACGHPCRLTCHPFDHPRVNCMAPCERKLPCNHPCTKPCHAEQCECSHGHTYDAYSSSDSLPLSMVDEETGKGLFPVILDLSSRPTSPTDDPEITERSVVRREEVVVPKIVHRRMFVNQKVEDDDKPQRQYLGPPVPTTTTLPPITEHRALERQYLGPPVQNTSMLPVTKRNKASGALKQGYLEPLVPITNLPPITEHTKVIGTVQREHLEPPMPNTSLPQFAKHNEAPSAFKQSLPKSLPTNTKEVKAPVAFEQTLIQFSDESDEVKPTPIVNKSLTKHAGNLQSDSLTTKPTINAKPIAKATPPVVKRKSSPVKPLISRAATPQNVQDSRSSSSAAYYVPNANPEPHKNLQAWQDFANGGAKAADEALEKKADEAAKQRRLRALDEQLETALRTQSMAVRPKSGWVEVAAEEVRPRRGLIDVSPPRRRDVTPSKEAATAPAAKLPSYDLLELAFGDDGAVEKEKENEPGSLVEAGGGGEGGGRRVRRHLVWQSNVMDDGWYEEPPVEKSLLD